MQARAASFVGAARRHTGWLRLTNAIIRFLPMSRFEDLSGRRFGRLVVASRGPNSASGCVRWSCRCDCGRDTIVWARSLKSGDTTSCGCFHREGLRQRSVTHGHAQGGDRSIEYRIYKGMRGRCLNARIAAYPDYGGRGIKICRAWLESFQNFLNDMGRCPPGHTLERIANDGDYEPSNCRWATRKEQARNRRSSHILTVDGVSLPLVAWAERLGLHHTTILYRLRAGWSERDSVLTPVTGTQVRRTA